MGLLNSGAKAFIGGAGAGTVAVAKEVGDFLAKSELQEEAGKIQSQREQTLADINNRAAQARVETQEGGLNARNAADIGSREREGAANREANVNLEGVRGFNNQALEGMRQDYERDRDKLRATLTREEIASHEAVGRANNQTSRDVARLGGSIQQDKDGTILYIGKDGTTKTLADPRDPTKPLVGFKDLTPAAKAYADVIKEQLKGLDKEEVGALDESARSTISTRRARLNADLLNVLTGGISEANKNPAPGRGSAGAIDRPPLGSFAK